MRTSLEKRAEVYDGLASTLDAGVPAARALRAVGEATRDASVRDGLGRAASAIESQGFTFLEALDVWESRLPEFERGLIDVGERSGRISTTLRSLAETLRSMAWMRRRTLAGLAYPMLLVHLAVVAFSIVGSVARGGGLGDALSSAVVGLVMLDVGLAVGFLTLRTLGRQEAAGLREGIFHWVPFLGQGLRSYALARLSMTLRGLLSAGAQTRQSWLQSATACGSAALKKDVEAWAPRIEEGLPPSEGLRSSRVFPAEFFTIYQVGEESGQIDDSLDRLSKLYRERGDESIRRFAEWTPRFVYGIVVVAIAILVIGAAGKYIRFLDSL